MAHQRDLGWVANHPTVGRELWRAMIDHRSNMFKPPAADRVTIKNCMSARTVRCTVVVSLNPFLYTRATTQPTDVLVRLAQLPCHDQ